LLPACRVARRGSRRGHHDARDTRRDSRAEHPERAVACRRRQIAGAAERRRDVQHVGAAGHRVRPARVARQIGDDHLDLGAERRQTPTILRPEVIAAGGATIAQLLLSITRADAPPLEGFAIMLHSSASEPAARIAREQLEQHYQKTLAALLGDAQRSALFLALVAGIQIMRQSIALTALADEGRLAAALAPAIDLLLAPPPAKKPAR
jgi:hypothetical protein